MSAPCVRCGKPPTFHQGQGHTYIEVAPRTDLRPSPRALSSLDRNAPAPLLLDRLDPIEPTILYGPGGVGKGALASSWITRLDERVLILDYEDHGGEWARRIAGLAGPDILDDVHWIAPYRDGLGPIWDSAKELAKVIDGEGYGYLVIDSVVMACAGKDPAEPATPTRYFEALQEMGVPSLSLGHVTKLHDARYPFGSAFWANLARVTWSLMPKGDAVLLSCTKASNYAKPAAATVAMTWHEGVLREVHEQRASVTLLDAIAAILADGPMTTTAIAAALNEGLPSGEHTKADTIRRTLTRDLARGSSRFTTSGGSWELKDTDG